VTKDITKPSNGEKEKAKMTDQESGKKTEDKTVVDIAVQRMREENLELATKLKVALDALENVTKERNVASQFLEENERGKAIDALRTMGCTYSIEEFDGMKLGALDELKQHYRYFQPPVFKSGADVSKARKSIYDSLDDLFVPLDVRKKAYQEA
jgi:hypothetical protein